MPSEHDDIRITPFQQKVYDACRRIPPGRVSTYKLLARAIGCGSARAVGQALRRNPFAPDVPCHRVIASDGTLGGFAGQAVGKALRRKQSLLQAEGIVFSEGTLADPSRIFRLD
jgi:methylated-DNA-[protein]-cysteine S-methyltransferase